jgi:hypothetical protein
MKWAIYGVAVLLVMVCVALVSMPLGFVLARTGLGGLGIGWSQAQGTIVHGSISGLFTPNQAVGDVGLRLNPTSLLGGTVQYRVEWGGVGGRGQGVLNVRTDEVELSGLRLRQQIAAIEGLMPQVRAIGGEIRLFDAKLRLDATGCAYAEGRVSSDILSRISAQYGRRFGPVEGTLSCRDGDFAVSLFSESDLDDTVRVDASYALTGLAEARIEVSTGDAALALALSQASFTPEDGLWVFESLLDGGFQ